MSPSSVTAPREVFPRIAGDVALDLVNTVSWRLNPHRRTEHFSSFSDCLRWTRQFGLIDSASQASLEAIAEEDSHAAKRELGRMIALREALYEAAFHEGPTEPIVREYARAVAAGRLEQQAGAWRWTFPTGLAAPRRHIAVASLELLLHGDLGHLGQCSDSDCGWVYLDSSPRHNRRWCVASDCGNRNRVREHYARVRAEPPA